MAKDIDLTRRVTGGAPPLRVPPPAKPQAVPKPPAGKPLHGLPLGRGQVVAMQATDPPLTALERAVLDRAGVKPGQPVPGNIQEMAQAFLSAEDAVPMQPPVPADTPYKALETVDISQLNPTARAEVLRKIEEVQQMHQPGTKQAIRSFESPSIASQAIPGARPSDPAHWPTLPNPQAFPQLPTAPPTARREEADPEVEMDLPPLPPAGEPAPPTPEAQADTDVDDVGAVSKHECPHCGWDLSRPDILEPSYSDKQVFLQAILGQKPYVKVYPGFGGALKMTFRTLTTKEVDKIYAQVLQESRDGKIPTTIDYWERINRYRLYLQILKLEMPQGVVDLPEGFTPETNPYAQSHWKIPVLPEGDTGLTLVDDYMTKEILRTEMLHVCVQNECAEFNRLVSRLEALMDQSDFWNKTEERS